MRRKVKHRPENKFLLNYIKLYKNLLLIFQFLDYLCFLIFVF